ncbi:Cyclin-G-associated kinase [Hondaea fermentalgiana]|uniref:Cyclin-G-associated kinase n=1 Tax=Hondaea fermentalgiana TaxID=2315210 RepID=A0A2R5GHF5_9STRA|nr:Cyclin-G-associated kinase [Hondaea fermentalgiana]|eukprot:GBG30312.1 Cyclin-G-associated kinase [Hondaea fermentalgiana]
MSVFYFVQGERGEDLTHPNMFALREASARPTLGEIKAQFPVQGAADDFHWRFRTSAGAKKGGFVWVDMTKDADAVPTQGGNVFAKLLRLSTLRCAANRQPPRRAGVSKSQASLPSRAAHRNPAPQSAAESADAGEGDVYDFWENSKSGSSAPNAGANGSAQAQTRSTTTEDEEDLFGTRSSSSGGATKPPAASKTTKPAPKRFTGVLPDEDTNHPALRGLTGDARAKKRVELRKQAEIEQQQKKVAELRAREDAAARTQEEFALVKGALQDKLSQWAGPKGNEKNVRALLSTLHSVLWEGARWKQVTVLVQPLEVKKAFRLSMLVVHPDKIDKNAAPDVKFIAQHCFDALKTQYAIFEQRELS